MDLPAYTVYVVTISKEAYPMKMTMKILTISVVLLILLATSVFAQDVRVKGYDRQDGTHVNSYMRTAPDSTRDNNFSTRGNTNPYTGEAGHKAPDSSYSQPRSSYGNSGLGGGNYGSGVNTGYGHSKRGW
jgi:opacity protein-like surface antigen